MIVTLVSNNYKEWRSLIIKKNNRKHLLNKLFRDIFNLSTVEIIEKELSSIG